MKQCPAVLKLTKNKKPKKVEKFVFRKKLCRNHHVSDSSTLIGYQDRICGIDEYFTGGKAENAVVELKCQMQIISGKVGIQDSWDFDT